MHCTALPPPTHLALPPPTHLTRNTGCLSANARSTEPRTTPTAPATASRSSGSSAPRPLLTTSWSCGCRRMLARWGALVDQSKKVNAACCPPATPFLPWLACCRGVGCRAGRWCPQVGAPHTCMPPLHTHLRTQRTPTTLMHPPHHRGQPWSTPSHRRGWRQNDGAEDGAWISSHARSRCVAVHGRVGTVVGDVHGVVWRVWRARTHVRTHARTHLQIPWIPAQNPDRGCPLTQLCGSGCMLEGGGNCLFPPKPGGDAARSARACTQRQQPCTRIRRCRSTTSWTPRPRSSSACAPWTRRRAASPCARWLRPALGYNERVDTSAALFIITRTHTRKGAGRIKDGRHRPFNTT